MLTTRMTILHLDARPDANGKIIARQAKIVHEHGAYSEKAVVVEKSTNRCVGPHAIPNA